MPDERINPENMPKVEKQYIVRSFNVSAPEKYTISRPMTLGEADNLARITKKDPNFHAEVQEYTDQKAGQY